MLIAAQASAFHASSNQAGHAMAAISKAACTLSGSTSRGRYITTATMPPSTSTPWNNRQIQVSRIAVP